MRVQKFHFFKLIRGSFSETNHPLWFCFLRKYILSKIENDRKICLKSKVDNKRATRNLC